jgi:hypothetical protein
MHYTQMLHEKQAAEIAAISLNGDPIQKGCQYFNNHTHHHDC